MYHWQKKLDAIELPPFFEYKGLVFPLYRGRLGNDELNSGQIFYAFFGCRHLTERAIKYYVDKMIATGEYEAA